MSNTIPGYFTEEDFLALDKIISFLPESGQILEYGSLFGKSLSHMLKTLECKNYKFFAIDQWSDGLIERFIKHNLEYKDLLSQFNSSKEAFDYFIGHRNNLITIQTIFDPHTFVWKYGELNFVFIDAEHGYAETRDAILFWAKYICKFNGIIAWHDHNTRSVHDGAMFAAKQLQKGIIKISDFIAYMQF